MKREVLVVDDTFDIKDRGLVIAGFLEEGAPELRVGDRIEILKPDGSKINSEVAGVEMIGRKRFPVSDQKKDFAFMVRNLSRGDVPKGSVINLITSQED